MSCKLWGASSLASSGIKIMGNGTQVLELIAQWLRHGRCNSDAPQTTISRERSPPVLIPLHEVADELGRYIGGRWRFRRLGSEPPFWEPL